MNPIKIKEETKTYTLILHPDTGEEKKVQKQKHFMAQDKYLQEGNNISIIEWKEKISKE